jgi:DNA-binding winged helix-turn-helix (wHTH) protein
VTQASGSPGIQRFGPFEFDPVAGELHKRGMKVKLQGQPIDILAMLLERPGQIVTREEIQKKLWHADTNVEFEHSVNAACEQKGNFPRSIAELKKAINLSEGNVIQTFVAHAYAVSGRRAEAREMIKKLKQPSGKCYVDPWAIALVYAGLAEKDHAMEWLETAYRNRDHDLVFCKTWPQFDVLRSDPRFQDLMRRMNFPPN